MIFKRLLARLLVALAVVLAGCSTGTQHTGSSKVVAARCSAAQAPSAAPSGSVASTLYPPPVAGGLTETQQLSVCEQGNGRFFFQYEIRNDGSDACLPEALVILH